MWFWRLRYRSACRSFVRLMTRQQVSVTSAVAFRIRSVVWSLAKRVKKLVGVQQLSHFVHHRGGFVSEAQTLYSLCSQMFSSDILGQGGVGVKSSRQGIFIWFRRHGKGKGCIDSRPAALVRETASPFGLEAADVAVGATIGSAQTRVNSRRHRLAPTEENIFMTPTGRRSWTTTVFTGRLSEGVQQEASSR